MPRRPISPPHSLFFSPPPPLFFLICAFFWCVVNKPLTGQTFGHFVGSFPKVSERCEGCLFPALFVIRSSGWCGFGIQSYFGPFFLPLIPCCGQWSLRGFCVRSSRFRYAAVPSVGELFFFSLCLAGDALNGSELACSDGDAVPFPPVFGFVFSFLVRHCPPFFCKKGYLGCGLFSLSFPFSNCAFCFGLRAVPHPCSFWVRARQSTWILDYEHFCHCPFSPPPPSFFPPLPFSHFPFCVLVFLHRGTVFLFRVFVQFDLWLVV